MIIRVAILEQSSRGQPKRLVINVIMLNDLTQIPEGFDGIESNEASPDDEWDGQNFTAKEQSI